MEDEDTREARRREIRATIRCALIVLGISAGAFLVASIISGCQVPQVCKHCWVAK